MSGRRGILGGLAALGIGGAAQRGAVGLPPAASLGQVPGMPMGASQVAYGVGAGMAQARPDPVLLKLFRSRVDAEWARRNRLQARMAFTGGIPPGVAACCSWRPWFKAAVAERWIAENLSDPRDFERAIWKAVFGRDMDGEG